MNPKPTFLGLSGVCGGMVNRGNARVSQASQPISRYQSGKHKLASWMAVTPRRCHRPFGVSFNTLLESMVLSCAFSGSIESQNIVLASMRLMRQ